MPHSTSWPWADQARCAPGRVVGRRSASARHGLHAACRPASCCDIHVMYMPRHVRRRRRRRRRRHCAGHIYICVCVCRALSLSWPAPWLHIQVRGTKKLVAVCAVLATSVFRARHVMRRRLMLRGALLCRGCRRARGCGHVRSLT